MSLQCDVIINCFVRDGFHKDRAVKIGHTLFSAKVELSATGKAVSPPSFGSLR